MTKQSAKATSYYESRMLSEVIYGSRRWDGWRHLHTYTNPYTYTYVQIQYIHDPCVGWREAHACIHIQIHIHTHTKIPCINIEIHIHTHTKRKKERKKDILTSSKANIGP